jgi:hypothetical protein
MGHPGDEFSDYGQEWKENELPPHQVTASTATLDRDEVRASEWARLLDALLASDATGAAVEAHYDPLQPEAWAPTARSP